MKSLRSLLQTFKTFEYTDKNMLYYVIALLLFCFAVLGVFIIHRDFGWTVVYCILIPINFWTLNRLWRDASKKVNPFDNRK